MNNKNLTQQFLQKIKQNKKYSSIADDIIRKEIKFYLKSNPKTTHQTKQDVKEIRAKLHRLYSTYQTRNKKKINKYLEELKNNINNKNINEITSKLLSLTLSTKERLPYYKLVYSKIFKITKKPKTIIDLGAGLNPFSIPLMNLNNLIYYSYDINTEDIKSLNKYFKIIQSLGIKGNAKILDIRNINKLNQLPKADITLIFKIVDLLTTKQAEQIILTLKSKYIITSFATKTITRKSMIKPKRQWFEMMLERNDLKYKIIKTDNEVFYVISEN